MPMMGSTGSLAVCARRSDGSRALTSRQLAVFYDCPISMEEGKLKRFYWLVGITALAGAVAPDVHAADLVFLRCSPFSQNVADQSSVIFLAVNLDRKATFTLGFSSDYRTWKEID